MGKVSEPAGLEGGRMQALPCPQLPQEGLKHLEMEHVTVTFCLAGD